MNFNVPQFIDVEDKIAFQMTAKQLGWYAVGGGVLFFAWNFIPKGAFIFLAIFVALICTGFAFFKPSGMSLFKYMLTSMGFLVKPKVMVWHREVKGMEQEMPVMKKKSNKKEVKINRVMKEKNLKKSADLADLLDKQSDI